MKKHKHDLTIILAVLISLNKFLKLILCFFFSYLYRLSPSFYKRSNDVINLSILSEDTLDPVSVLKPYFVYC